MPETQPIPARPARRRRGATLAALAAGGLLSAVAVAPPAHAGDAPIKAGTATAIPGRYIVVLKDGADAAAVARGNGIRPTFVYSATIDGFAGPLSRAQLAKIRKDPSVAYVSPDGVATISGKPRPAGDGSETSLSPRPSTSGDVSTRATQYGATWGLDRVDQRTGTNTTYNYTATGAGVRAYVIDTGIHTAHSQFGGRATVGFDSVGDGRNGQDCNGHGTHVAGTIGGATHGVAKSVRLTAVRVLNCAGSGSFAGVIAGIDWVTYHHDGPSVANMSLGGGFSQPINDAVAKSIAHGVTYAVAAGNANQNACTASPASAPGALTVGATDAGDVRAAFSNFGPCVDVFDPGVNITSAWIGSTVATNTISGTSMAAPHVAGLTALYLQANPYATPALVADVVRSTAVVGIVGNPGAGSPNLFARKWNGALSGTGASQYQPDGSYWYQSTTGYIQGWLAGTPGTDADLYLQRWNGSAWVTVAGSASLTPNERVVHLGTPAYYRLQVYAFSGGGSYDAWSNHPA